MRQGRLKVGEEGEERGLEDEWGLTDFQDPSPQTALPDLPSLSFPGPAACVETAHSRGHDTLEVVARPKGATEHGCWWSRCFTHQ